MLKKIIKVLFNHRCDDVTADFSGKLTFIFPFSHLNNGFYLLFDSRFE